MKILKIKDAAWNAHHFGIEVTPTEGDPFLVSLGTLEDLLALARATAPGVLPASAPPAPTEADLRATIVQMIRQVEETAEFANPRAYALARGERVDPPLGAGDPGVLAGSLAVHRASRRDGLRMRALAANVGVVVPDALGHHRGAAEPPAAPSIPLKDAQGNVLTPAPRPSRVAVGIDWAASKTGPHTILKDTAGGEYVLSDMELTAWGGGLQTLPKTTGSASEPLVIPEDTPTVV